MNLETALSSLLLIVTCGEAMEEMSVLNSWHILYARRIDVDFRYFSSVHFVNNFNNCIRENFVSAQIHCPCQKIYFGPCTLVSMYRSGRPICRKVFKIMSWEVPPADWLML